MLLLALTIAALSGQDATPDRAGSSERYTVPAIRPYEPPSGFGRQVEEGDVGRPIRSRPITAPVAVEAYTGDYEQSRTTAEALYDQAVKRARASADARMGPLDGIWSAFGTDGRPVLELVLSDRGPSKPVEGALSLGGPTRTTVPVAAVVEDGGETVIDGAVDGRAVRLRLRPNAAGWTGTLSGLGRDQTVSLSHPD